MSTTEYLPPDQDTAAPSTSGGWFKASRSADAFELQLAAPNAFRLAWIIAYRARYSNGFNRHGIDTGEAMLGDYETCGFSEQEYRTAKKFLAKWKFATFRVTPKGTIARLMDTRLFEVLPMTTNTLDNGQPTDSQRTANGQPTDS